jgi:hypothetical protein
MDVFDSSAVMQNAQANLAQDLPAGFSEAFDVSSRSLSEWNSGVAYNNARDRALATYYDDVKQKTGVQLPLYGMGGNVSLDELNVGIGKIAQDHPDQGFMPISESDIDTMARRRMAKAHDDAAAFANRETTWGGTAGTISGTLLGALSDPVTIATLPLGGAGEAGIVLRALEFAAIAGGTEATNAAMSVQSREAAVPGSSKDIPGDIAGATLFGAGLGGAFGALGKLLGHGAKPLPTSVRDEVNAATSELQFHATNPFPTAAGEAAARDATVEATTSLARGETVRAGENFDGAHVADYALAARLPGTVEKLSELQLGEIAQGVTAAEARAAKARALLEQQDTRIVKSEVAGLDRGDMLAKMRAEISDISAERAGVQAKIDATADPETAARLQAISEDLQKPGLPAAKAAELEQERATITETLAASTDRDGHLIVSLQQEASGLDKLLRRRTAAADKLQQVHDRTTSTSAGRRAAIEADRATIDATLTSHTEIIGNELRRAISRLAVEGYGVKLDRAEAQDLAEFVIGQRGEGASSALSHVTETLVSKAAAARQAELGEAGEQFLRPLTFGERPQVERFDVRPGDHAPPAPKPASGDVVNVPARDLTPEQVTKLAADPATDSAVLHNLDHIIAEKPDAEFTTQIRQPDGSYALETRKLSDVLAEIDGMETAAKELEACAVGLAVAAE